MSVQWHTYADARAAADACAHKIAALIEEALAGQELATLAVSGGSTPKLMFEKLASEPVRWDRVHLFWVDERSVPPTDAASNYKLTEDHLIARARI
ncbi:MAG: 6-phosphogluconolactonase, partial [Bryobacteraceae bacterium]